MPRAIDVHIHPPRFDGAPRVDTSRYLRGDPPPATADEMAQKYRDLDIFGVLSPINSESARGETAISNEYIAELVARYPEQFIGFGSVDPWRGKMAVKEVTRIKELGLRGVKLMPITQEFYMNETRFYPIYEKCVELGLVLLVHSGTTAAGAGQPGGGGLKLKYAQPIPYMDDVAADFPDLSMILAHPAFPWQEQQIAMMMHKPNVYMDLSGWSPKYFSPLLIQYANTLLQDRVLFGSDYPGFSIDRWLTDFAAVPFRDEVRPKILLENARRLLGLDI